MRRTGVAAVAALLAGCSNLTETGQDAVALRVLMPSPAAVEPGDTLQLQAQALNLDGDVIPGAVIYWRTPDTAALELVDSAGLVTARLTSGTGRVQARLGSLFSGLQTLALRRASDTLVVTGTRADTVVAPDTASDPLDAAVLSFTPDTAGISGTRIRFEVLDTVPGVHFESDLLTLSAATGTSGEPVQPVTLRRSSTATLGTVRVEISAARPSGKPVPGSPDTVSITFQ